MTFRYRVISFKIYIVYMMIIQSFGLHQKFNIQINSSVQKTNDVFFSIK